MAAGERGLGLGLPLADALEPEVGEVADAAALFVEDDGLPLLGEFGLVELDGGGDGAEEGGLAHAAWAYAEDVLRGLAGVVGADDVEQAREQGAARGELGEKHVRREQRGIV